MPAKLITIHNPHNYLLTVRPSLQTSNVDTMDTPTPKRKRSRQACQPCRERKRKCSGCEPCTTCTEWGYECFYEARHRPRKPNPKPNPDPDPDPDPNSNSNSNSVPDSPSPSPAARPRSQQSPRDNGAENSALVRRMEANSGAAFVRKLGLKIDPTRAPKLNLFGWNLGARQLSSSSSQLGLEASNAAAALPITEITSLEHMRVLARVYFEKLHPCYGFVHRRHFFERLEARWQTPLAPTTYDSVLSGAAALGCLFSQRNATITELHLVRTARSHLDNQGLSGPPSTHLITGWTLRTIYLRLTDSPHSTWMASSILMHLIEASGLHPESPPPVLLPNAQCDPDLKRRLVGVAHHLNAWTSFDLGLSRVSFRTDDLPPLPSPKSGDYTAEVLGLLPVSVSLDPSRLVDETDLTSILSRVLEGIHTQPPSVMAQCNLVLCILRRIQTQNLDLSSSLADQVLALLKKGLACARSMVMDCYPWHQVANVPFQTICVLLVLDTRSSLVLLPEAMQTLELISSTYDTETMREACRTACLLVVLHQQRRKDDITILGQALNQCPAIDARQQEAQPFAAPQVGASTEDVSWLGALVADLPGLQRVDLDQFLSTNMINDFPFLSGPS